MGYYMGDFYMGDPGFLSFFGRLAKRAVGLIPGVGPIASSAIGAVGSIAKVGGGLARRGKAAIIAHPVLSAAGAAGAVGAAGVGMHRMGAPAAAGMAHRGAGAALGRRRRRMRVTNPKALRRAIRRAEGFKRLAMRVLRFTGPHRPRGRAYFKPRKRKRI